MSNGHGQSAKITGMTASKELLLPGKPRQKGAPASDVLEGADGWLFHGGPELEFLHRFSAGDADDAANITAWQQVIAERITRCAAAGARYVHLIVPDKITIYAENLPRPTSWQTSPGHRLAKAVATSDPASIIQIAPAMRNARENQQLFWRTGSQLTSAGACLVYQMLCHHLDVAQNTAMLAAPTTSLTRVMDLARSIPGYPAETGKVRRITGDAQLIYENELVRFKARNGIAPGSGLDEGSIAIFANEAAADRRKVMIFGDDLCDYRPTGLTAMLAETFAEVCFVWSDRLDFNLIRSLAPDIVLSVHREAAMVRVPVDDLDTAAASRFAVQELLARNAAYEPVDGQSATPQKARERFATARRDEAELAAYEGERAESPLPSSAPRRWLTCHRWFLLFALLPILIGTLYFGFVDTDEYVSQSRFVVKSTESRGPQLSTLANLIQTTGMSRGQEETNAVLDYVQSRNALQDLNRQVNLRAVYARPEADLLSRYPFPMFDAGKFENLYDFYQDKVEVYLDNESGLAVLNVRAFTAKDAHTINQRLLVQSEGLVNQLNQRAHRKGIDEAMTRVREAEARVSRARSTMAGYRNSQDLIDPEKQAGGIFEIITALTSERAALQAQLDQMTRVAPNNPAIPGLRGRISAVSGELATMEGRVTGNTGALASKLGSYESLLAEQEFATQNLAAAQASLEQARMDATKQEFYLERVVDPDTPDLPYYPRRLKTILTLTAAILCLYFIGWMFVVGILEHAPED